MRYNTAFRYCLNSALENVDDVEYFFLRTCPKESRTLPAVKHLHEKTIFLSYLYTRVYTRVIAVREDSGKGTAWLSVICETTV
jgi:hypothetical protein